MTGVETILALFRQRGDTAYYGEPVSQTEHALQAADLAVREGAPDALVVAALLHDIGHLLHDLGEGIADQGVDACHEEAGERWLSARFGPEVTEPVRLHVAAKRYLCATDPEYAAILSPASTLSLKLQGGPMSASECAEFEQNPHYRAAVRLRRWDDTAKVRDLAVPGLEAYRDRLAMMLRGAP
jgi:phosphonate degradation associated HDIG domain protein